jgi:hypothetical protein
MRKHVKLIVRKETLRTLSIADLQQAAGGVVADGGDTEKNACVAAVPAAVVRG